MGRARVFVGLTSNVFRLGWVSLFADISSEMLYPVIPIFLTTVVGAPVSILGLIEGVAEATASLLKAVSGRLSDAQSRRKPFVFVGYVISAVAKPIMAIASGWMLILFARSLDRLGKGIRTSPRDALLADSVAAEYRGKAFGWHRGMDTLGAILGPLVAMVFLTKFHEDLRWVFVISFFPAILGALWVLSVDDLSKIAEQSQKKVAPLESHEGSGSKPGLPHSFRIYLIAWFCFSVTNSSDMFLILRAKELGLTTHYTLLLYAFYNVTYAAGSPWLGQLSDKIGRKWIVISGLFVFAFVYVGFALITHIWQLWILFGIYGIYIAATDGVGKALAVDLVSVETRAGALGLLGTVTGLASLLASPVAGLLWNIGSWATFIYGASGAVLGALIILIGLESHHDK